MVDGREVQEPTLLALGLTATGFLLLLAVLAGAVFATASFGLGWGLFAAVAGLLAALVLGPRRWHGESAAPVTGRRRWLRRLHGAGRKMFVVVLASWLGLIAWSEFSPRRADAGAEGGAGRRARPHLEHPPRAGARPAVAAEQLARAQAGAGRGASPGPARHSARAGGARGPVGLPRRDAAAASPRRRRPRRRRSPAASTAPSTSKVVASSSSTAAPSGWRSRRTGRPARGRP